MTRTRPPQLAFSSGEISPLLHSRPDYQRYQTGLAACVGFLPLRQGGFTRAPGTIFRGYTRNNARAKRIPFEFAVNDALELEFTDGYMRVWRYGTLVENGGSPYELAMPYDEAALDQLQFVQSADAIYICDGQSRMQKLSRLALDNWTIEPVDFRTGPFRVQNLDEAITIQCSASSGTITLTGVGTSFDTSWVGSLIRLVPTDFSAIALWTGNTAVVVGDKMRYGENLYKLTAGSDTGVNPPVHTSGERLVDKSKGTKWKHISDTSGIVKITTITDPLSSTAEVIKTVPDPCVTDPSYRWSEGAWSERWGYPKALEIFDEHLFAGFTSSEPRTLWASTVGDYEDFEPSADADGSFSYTISGSASLNSGNWLRAGKKGIYIGALGEVFRGFSNNSQQVIGPTTFDTELESTDGCTQAEPIAPYGYPVHITKDGGRVQEVRYSFQEDGGKPLELSLPAQHLGTSSGFEEIVWQSAPHRQAWLRRANGELASMLYDPDEDVLGWARCPVAGGVVEDLTVTTAADTGYDILTMVVRRVIDGQTVRMTEEQAVTFGVIAGEQPISEAVHFFASVEFTPDPATDTFSVPHLVGETVYVWTDAGQYGPVTVPAEGEITIDAPVNRAVVGLLDETHYAETLNIPAEAKDGSSLGRKRRLNAGSGIQLHRTAAGKIRTVERDFGQAERVSPQQDLVPLQVAADLSKAYSGITKTAANTGYSDEVCFRFEPYGGAPMTVLGVVPDIEETGA